MYAIRRALVLSVLMLTTLFSVGASAQQKTLYLDRVQLSGAPDDGFTVWRPYQWKDTRFYGNFALGYSLNPLRKQTLTDSAEVRRNSDDPVQHQVINYLSLGTQIAGRIGVNIMLPIAWFQDGGQLDDFSNIDQVNLSTVALHDARIDVRGLLFESNNKRFKVGANGALWLPTGNSSSVTGDDNVDLMIGPSLEYDFGVLLLAGNLNWQYRPTRGIDEELFISDELRWTVGGYLPFRDNTIRLGVEVHGSTGGFFEAEDNQNKFFEGRNTPVEWLAQGRFTLDKKKRWYVNAGAGTRISEGYGAPDLRVLASIGYWVPLADWTPNSPGRRYIGKPTNPDVEDHDPDTDGDGYPDSVDACPTVKEDGKKPNPTDGCPAPKDSDGDGIPDNLDKCPNEPEDKDGIDDEDGCPEEDADNDKIPDVEDKCPKKPGPRNKIAEKNGCPTLTQVTEDGEIMILKKIQFATGSSTIKQVSFPILDEVVTLMQARGGLRVGIYGHTDSRGSDALNMRLSKARARSVLNYLVRKGIAKSRLESEGFGEEKPIASNDTAEGRFKNRRVEFKILDEDDDDDDDDD